MQKKILFLILFYTLISAQNGFASGMVLHMWMADEAINLLEDEQLRNLLKEERNAYLYGSIFPDSGSAIGHPYGEFSHWDQFMNSYHHVIGEDCTELSSKECKTLYAHFLGSVAHSVADIYFDRHFITKAAFYDYNGDLSLSQKWLDTGLDMVSLFEGKRAFIQPIMNLPIKALLKVFALNSGLKVNENDLRRGARTHRLGMALEPMGASLSYHYYKSHLTWARKNVIQAKGGVKDTARKIAIIWTLLWQKRNSGEDLSHPFLTNVKWPYSSLWVYGHNLEDL